MNEESFTGPSPLNSTKGAASYRLTGLLELNGNDFHYELPDCQEYPT